MVKNSVLQRLLFLSAMVCFAAILVIDLLDFVYCLRNLKTEFFRVSHKGYLILMGILATAVVALFVYLKNRVLKSALKMRSPFVFAIILFIVSLSVKLLFVFITKTKQYSDFQLFYWVTSQIANKTPKYLSQPYFSIWAYQLGFPAVMSPVIKGFGMDIVPLLIANCIFMSITNVLLYLILREFCSDKTSRMVAFAYAFFPLNLSLSPVYTNQHLAAMLLFAGFYILIHKQRFTLGKAVIAGIFFSLSNMVRPEAVLMIAALLGYGVITVLQRFSKETLKVKFREVFLPVGCAILVYFIGNAAISKLFVLSGISPYGLSNNFPLYKFVVGLNHSTSGTFSKEDADKLFESKYFIENPDQRDEEAIKLIKERLSVGPKRLSLLLSKKIRIMWSCDASWYPAFNGIDLNKSINILNISIPVRFLLYLFTAVDSAFYLLIFLFGIISMLTALKAEKNSSVQIISVTFFIVTFFVYWLIEVQHRYAYIAFFALFVVASKGFEGLFRRRCAS